MAKEKTREAKQYLRPFLFDCYFAKKMFLFYFDRTFNYSTL